MPIVQSTITRDHNRGNGTRSIHEQHVDHLGEIHAHRYTAPLNYDADASLLEWVPLLEGYLIQGEKDSVKQAVKEGVDPSGIPRKHLTTTQKARAVIKALMLGSPEKMLKAAQYVQGFTNTQIENFFTQAQRVRIRVRQNYILDNQATFNADTREEL